MIKKEEAKKIPKFKIGDLVKNKWDIIQNNNFIYTIIQFKMLESNDYLYLSRFMPTTRQYYIYQIYGLNHTSPYWIDEIFLKKL